MLRCGDQVSFDIIYSFFFAAGVFFVRLVSIICVYFLQNIVGNIIGNF